MRVAFVLYQVEESVLLYDEIMVSVLIFDRNCVNHQLTGESLVQYY